MMIVIVIMGILLSIALPIYNQSLVRSREAVLRQDLFTLRNADLAIHARQAKSSAVADDLVQAATSRQFPRIR